MAGYKVLFLDKIPPTFIKFFLVGALGFVVDVAVLYAAIHLGGFGPMASRLISFLAAATFTWSFNRRFTFGASQAHRVVEWSRFLMANAVGQGINLSVYALALWLLAPAFWTPLMAAAVGSLSGLLFNYGSSRSLVFSKS
jgi:putative flippase GtrA